MYTNEIATDGCDLIPVNDFFQAVCSGLFVDGDGVGYPAREGKMDRSRHILPSSVRAIPQDATHVAWFNK